MNLKGGLLDAVNVPRGSDGAWDVGVYEFVDAPGGGDAILPNAPNLLRAVQ